MRWLPLAALVLVFLASGAAPVPKHLIKDEPFWPTAVGTKWVYEEKAGEQVDEITKVEKKPTGTLLTIRMGLGMAGAGRRIDTFRRGIK